MSDLGQALGWASSGSGFRFRWLSLRFFSCLRFLLGSVSGRRSVCDVQMHATALLARPCVHVHPHRKRERRVPSWSCSPDSRASSRARSRSRDRHRRGKRSPMSDRSRAEHGTVMDERGTDRACLTALVSCVHVGVQTDHGLAHPTDSDTHALVLSLGWRVLPLPATWCARLSLR